MCQWHTSDLWMALWTFHWMWGVFSLCLVFSELEWAMSASDCIAFLLASALVLKCRHIVGSRVKAIVAAGRANVKACSKKLQSEDTGAVDTGAVDTGAVDTGAVDTSAVDNGAEWWIRSQASASTSGVTISLMYARD